MNKKPLVSVVITCYNYAKYLKEAIDSVLNQAYKNIEIIVINDGSTDNSDEIARSYGQKIQYFYQENAGVIATRNKGIEKANGEFLVFLDADDRLGVRYIEEVVALAAKKKADIVYTDVRLFDQIDIVSHYPQYNIEILKNDNFIHISSLIRRSVIGETRFDAAMSKMTHEDWDFFLALCLKGASVVKCSSVFLEYRIHNGSRNNRLETTLDKNKYTKTYRYVIDKYISGDKKEEFSYLQGYIFAEWYALLYDEFQPLQHSIEEQKSEIIALREELDEEKRKGVRSRLKRSIKTRTSNLISKVKKQKKYIK